MFLVERLTKWRMTSGSVSSGNGGAPAASSSGGTISASDLCGTSHGGSVAPRRPGFDSSNSGFVANSLRMPILVPNGSLRSRRVSGTVGKGPRQTVDFRARSLLGDGDQQAFLGVRHAARAQ